MYYSYDERQQKLVDVFTDTKKFYNEKTLRDKVEISIENTCVYDDTYYPTLDGDINRKCIIETNMMRTFEAAIYSHKQYYNAKIGVLNFASATNPGGGVTKGSSAQEEALCRCSTLYPTLDQPKIYDQFYNINRNMKDCIHTDRLIYSPDILIIKSDESFPKRLDSKNFISVDVISCAAPNLRTNRNSYADTDTGKPITLTDKELYDIHFNRAKHIMHIFSYRKVDIVILGAFGCGAFKNDPKVVANAWNDAIKDYKRYFMKIIFAIYCSSRDIVNFNTFKTIIK